MMPPNQAKRRLLAIDAARGSLTHHTTDALPTLLSRGDLVVVNDAATLPASIRMRVSVTGELVELRLASEITNNTARAVLFGKGDFRIRTEDREPPPVLHAGTVLVSEQSRATGHEALRCMIASVDSTSPRLVAVRFIGDELAVLDSLYRTGVPIQYAHEREPLSLYAVQTLFATRPFAVEPPSATFALSFGALRELNKRGVGVASLTHAAGLSATGDPLLDARLPLEERFVLPEKTARAVEDALVRNTRVVAIGTTVARALESAIRIGDGRIAFGEQRTALRLGRTEPRRVVHAIVTGVHAPNTSHFELLHAFAGEDLLARASAEATHAGYREHEFGDNVIVLAEKVDGSRSREARAGVAEALC